MEKAPKSKFSNEYLKKKIEKEETLSGEDFLKLRDLTKPVAKIEYKDKDHIKIKKEDLEIDFSYESLSDNLLVKRPEDLKELDSHDRKIVGMMDSKPEEFREIKRFVIKNGNGKFDLFDHAILKNYRVYFNKQSKDPIIGMSSGSVSVKDGVIFIRGDMLSPDTIFSLFHELGHAVNYGEMSLDQRTDTVQNRKYFNLLSEENTHLPPTIIWDGLIGKYKTVYSKNVLEIDEDVFSSVLEDERSAWAFSLKKLKPFLKNLKISKEDLKVIIHKYSLGSYSKSMQRQMEKSLEQETDKILRVGWSGLGIQTGWQR